MQAEVTGNEPIDGLGEEDIALDWTKPVIDQDTGTVTLQLRAECSGSGDRRTYTVGVSVCDSVGCRTAYLRS